MSFTLSSTIWVSESFGLKYRSVCTYVWASVSFVLKKYTQNIDVQNNIHYCFLWLVIIEHYKMNKIFFNHIYSDAVHENEKKKKTRWRRKDETENTYMYQKIELFPWLSCNMEE